MEPTPHVSRRQVIDFRWRAHQLDRAPGAGAGVEVDLLDLGVQDTGVGGAGWALEIRGGTQPEPDELLFAWTVRGAPHAYRRADLAAVVVATAPLSEADAGKRIYDAYRPLKAAGRTALDALATIARHERDLAAAPIVKGDLSGGLTPLLPEAMLRFCRPCGVTHPWELPFRLAALQAGLELEPGTSPPVLRRAPGFRPRPYGKLGVRADPRLDVVRTYLRFFGPARVRDVATYLDAPAADVTAHWPADAVEVTAPELTGAGARFVLADDLPALTAEPGKAAGTVRLAGPYDAYLQLKDRETLVDDEARRKDVWRTLGRPGVVLLDGEVVATWRPKASGKTLKITLDAWRAVPKTVTASITAEAERFAAFRGLRFAGLLTP